MEISISHYSLAFSYVQLMHVSIEMGTVLNRFGARHRVAAIGVRRTCPGS